jgi:N-acetyl-anhydromuramyl-L-alanine amidase AmpD
MDPHVDRRGFLIALERFGYDIADPLAAVVAFQRRFRPGADRRRQLTASAARSCSPCCCQSPPEDD